MKDKRGDIYDAIHSIFPDLTMDIKYDEVGKHYLVQSVIFNGTLNVNTDDPLWKKLIIKQIDMIVHREQYKECYICCNPQNKWAMCGRCSQPVCLECTIDIIKKNNGLFMCPNCRFEDGRVFDTKSELDVVLNKIRKQADDLWDK